MKRAEVERLLILIQESLHDRLRDAAGERDVSVNLLVLRAVDDYLNRLVPADEAVTTNR